MSVKSHLFFCLLVHQSVVFGQINQTQQKIRLEFPPNATNGKLVEKQTHLVEFTKDTARPRPAAAPKNTSEATWKNPLKHLFKKRGDMVSFYKLCAQRLDQDKKKQQMDIIRKELQTLKKELIKLNQNQPNVDLEVMANLYDNLCNKTQKKAKRSVSIKAMYERYEALTKFLETWLRDNVHEKEVINKPFWTTMKKFYTDSFEYLGVNSSYVDKVENSVPDSSKTAPYKVPIENLLRKSQITVTQYHTCTSSLDRDKQKLPYRIIAQSATKLRLALENVNEPKTQACRDQLKKALWSGPVTVRDAESAFVKYEFLYSLLLSHLQNFVKKADDLDSQHWKRVIDFLNDPYKFLDITNVPELELYGFGSSKRPTSVEKTRTS